MVVAISMASSTSTLSVPRRRPHERTGSVRVAQHLRRPQMSLGLRQELVGLCAVGRHPGDLATCQHLVDHGGGETWAHVCPAGAVAFTARATWGRALTVVT